VIIMNFKKEYYKIFKKVLSKVGDLERAVKISRTVFQKKLASLSEVTAELGLKPSGVAVGKSGEGKTLVEFVLTGKSVDAHNQRLTDSLLHKILSDIKSGKEILGDVEHASMNPDEKDPLLKMPVLKLVDGKIVDGELYAVAEFLPHPYLDSIKNAVFKGDLSGVSIELVVPSEEFERGVLSDGSIVGFSLTRKPAYQNAKIFRIKNIAG